MRIPLAYGKTQIDFEFDPKQFEILATEHYLNALSDHQIGERLDNPIDSKPLEEIVKPGERVLIVVPDATRMVGAGQIANILIRRLIAAGTNADLINIIFATGIHRSVTEAEKAEILTPFIAQRIKTLEHDAENLAQMVRIGETSTGIPIEINRYLLEYENIVTIGGINFHYFAGFTGGRKMICPGLASKRTISETHRLAFDFENKTRTKGVGSGIIEGNPVHEAFIEIVEKCPPTFSINSVVNDKGVIIDLFAGNWKTAHEMATGIFAKNQTIKIGKKRDVVVVSCGGYPHDANMIQAHKAIEMAAHACKVGGTIIFLAACEDGLGRADFLDWFEARDSKHLGTKLTEKYQVNGQTAWSLLQIAEEFDVKILTELDDRETRSMRLKKQESLRDHQKENAEGYIIPFGAKFKIELH